MLASDVSVYVLASDDADDDIRFSLLFYRLMFSYTQLTIHKWRSQTFLELAKNCSTDKPSEVLVKVLRAAYMIVNHAIVNESLFTDWKSFLEVRITPPPTSLTLLLLAVLFSSYNNIT